ncbi:MAG: T9SS type A sorting domain-containing protein [Bacteroidia bacterium]
MNPIPCFALTATSITPSTYSNVAIAGSSSSWLNAANVATSDNVYVSIPANSLSAAGQFTDYLQVTNFGFAIPAASVIDGILVEIERSDVNNAKDNAVRIVRGGIVRITDRSVTPAWSSETYAPYGSATDLWGEAWTVAEINSAGFGVAFSCRKQGGGANPIPIVDHVRITVYYTSTLPIELLFFRASAEDQKVNLSWETASELNNHFFTIERSSDGLVFEEIERILGAGNSTQNNFYQYTDSSPFAHTSYYRLKQTDFNGEYSYSRTIAVTLASISGVTFDVYYETGVNPTFHILSDFGQQIADISVYTADGRLVSMQQIELQETNTSFVLNIELKGVYLFCVESNGKRCTKKIFIP